MYLMKLLPKAGGELVKYMLDIQRVAEILSDSDKLQIGMRKYKKIMDSLFWTDVSKDKEFQRAFNDFFVMRSRKSEYYDMFYSYLEEKKNTGVSFEELLCYLKGAEGRMELSFASKFIHIINPNRPIWDSIVSVQQFGMKIPKRSADGEARQKEIVKIYHEYCSRFYEYLDSSEGQSVIRLFNEKYPHTGFTDAKKIDFILWIDGSTETMKKRIESEQRAIKGMTNDDLVCKDCLLRFDDTQILGNVSKCEQYPDCKPIPILQGGKCDKYIKE